MALVAYKNSPNATRIPSMKLQGQSIASCMRGPRNRTCKTRQVLTSGTAWMWLTVLYLIILFIHDVFLKYLLLSHNINMNYMQQVPLQSSLLVCLNAQCQHLLTHAGLTVKTGASASCNHCYIHSCVKKHDGTVAWSLCLISVDGKCSW